MNQSSLVSHFDQYFDIRRASTPELLAQVFRIRYHVYCLEFGYERAEDCPGGLERDDYDDHSTHCLIVHRASGLGAGCIRIVTPPLGEAGFLLPLERFCGHSLIDPELSPSRMPSGSVAEVSRLAVQTQFRRRSGEDSSPGIRPVAPV